MKLTQEQIDAFARDGYLPYERILTAEELERLRGEYDHEFAAGPSRNLSAPQQLLQIMQMCERNIHFRKLMYDARILDVVQDLIGPNIMLIHDQALFKPAHHGGEVPWHQDNGYWRCRPANLVSCWLALDDADAENGAMQVIPGSHLRPYWHASKAGDLKLDIREQMELSNTVTVALPAGACLFHHCQTLHHTNPNTTPRQRRAYVMHFMTPGTMNGETNEMLRVGWNHPVLRMAT